jgi:hypothetical protein
MALGKLLDNAVMSHNKALQPTANPLRGLPAAELGRSTATNAYDGECRLSDLNWESLMRL